MKNAERTALTKPHLHDAFLDLRRRKSLEQIRVTELCMLANTNRTTFYHYFEDVYDLNDAVENQILTDCLEDFAYRGLIYDDPEKFLNEFSKALNKRETELAILGHGRLLDQYAKIEEWLVELARRDHQSVDEEFFLTFVIGGLVHVMNLNQTKKKYSKDLVNKQMLALIQKGIKMNNSI